MAGAIRVHLTWSLTSQAQAAGPGSIHSSFNLKLVSPWQIGMKPRDDGIHNYLKVVHSFNHRDCSKDRGRDGGRASDSSRHAMMTLLVTGIMMVPAGSGPGAGKAYWCSCVARIG